MPGQAPYLLAITLLLAGRPLFAEHYDPYQKSISSEQAVQLKSARTLRSERQIPQAQQVLKNLIQKQPDYYLAHYNLGMTYLEQGRYEEGIPQLEQAVAIREKSGIPEYSIYNSLGWAHLNVEHYAAAEQNFLVVLEHAAENRDALNRRALDNLGLLYYLRQDYVQAQKYLTRSIDEYHSSDARNTLKLVHAAVAKEQELLLERYVQLAIEDGEYIGNRIWHHESDGTELALTGWDEGEQHASIGIGHFIWYPAGQEGPFQETFPRLVQHLEHLGRSLPDWLNSTSDCPWNSREEFMAALDSPRMRELRGLMKDTIPQQVDFMIVRLRAALPKMLESIPADERDRVREQFHRVAQGADGKPSRQGLFALLDYVHFKGEGTKPAERYQGKGWGLLQVLQQMPGDSDDPLREFTDAAMAVLKRRIALSPPERHEQRWLEGWKQRIDSYRNPIALKDE